MQSREFLREWVCARDTDDPQIILAKQRISSGVGMLSSSDFDGVVQFSVKKSEFFPRENKNFQSINTVVLLKTWLHLAVG